MKKFLVILVLCFLCIGAAAQQDSCATGTTPVCNSVQSTSVSGTALTIIGNGGLTPQFALAWTGSPTGVTTTIQGCSFVGSTTVCQSLDSYSGSTATLRTVDQFSVKVPSGPYNYYLVTSAWTGTSTFSVAARITIARRFGTGNSNPNVVVSVNNTVVSSQTPGTTTVFVTSTAVSLTLGAVASVNGVVV